MEMTVYGTTICINCRNFLHIAKERNLKFTFIDIIENTTNMKAFLKIRDTDPALACCAELGRIGIPCFVIDGKTTIDIHEAFRWLGEPEIRDDEIAEKVD